MAETVLLQPLQSLCPSIPREIITDFVSRMDEEYFEQFPLEQVAAHLHLSATISPEQPCAVDITPGDAHTFSIVIVAYDYFSEFAFLCGLLSSFELDIQEARIYTFSEAPPGARDRSRTMAFEGRSALALPRHPPRKAGLRRKKIVDVFYVRPFSQARLDKAAQQQLVDVTSAMVRLLDANRIHEARNLVNRRLVETLSRSRATFTGLMHPIHVLFDNEASPTDTIMDIRSTDTPAFLCAFANALAMRGIYIHKARVAKEGDSIRDRFFVRNRQGKKIERSEEQEELTTAAALIKQFTHSLTWAPDPAKALEHFDLWLDHLLEKGRRGRTMKVLANPDHLAVLARLFGTSDFLWEDFLRMQHLNLFPLLRQYRQKPLRRARQDLVRAVRQRMGSARSDEERRRALNAFKDQELLRIDMKHLLDPETSLAEFSEALTDLAEVVLDQAIAACRHALARRYGHPSKSGGQPCPFVVCALGKFGGRELGYASDIEVLFVYEGAGRTSGRVKLDNSEYFERLGQQLLHWIEAEREGIFELDIRLRPHGGQGRLVNSFEEFQSYYCDDGAAAPFERQALIKLRCAAGDRRLGTQVEAHRDGFVYSPKPWDLSSALKIRQQQIKESVAPGTVNVKYSPGGLIDVEYTVQYLQITHGPSDPRLHTPNTLQALSGLAEASILTEEEAATLRQAYLFFRTLIDGLRIVRGNAKDLVLPPPRSEGMIYLARRLGYHQDNWEDSASRLDMDVRGHMERVRAIFTRRFASP